MNGLTTGWNLFCGVVGIGVGLLIVLFVGISLWGWINGPADKDQG